LRPPALPAKSKIVVLGASGLIGRLVVRQLLESPQLDATIVALVRDYDKACRVLYDDLIVASSRRKGSKLVIVQGDLVPPEELPGFSDITASEGDENLEDRQHTVPLLSSEEDVLQEAIRDCTTIISCLGTVRITNVWTDFLVRPLWRLLRCDVSDWCNDPHHPYYVHYRTTQKVIHYAEREQIRRQAAIVSSNQERHFGSNQETPPRIRFIRISDLCVAQPPWFLIPLMTNIFHSMVFRYQLLADRLLDASAQLDTITIRPGDVVAEERDVETTALQVDPSGVVPYPARVGRDDTAELVVAAALWSPQSKNAKDEDDDRPFHFTWACRWVGRAMDPFPAQGEISDGHTNAHQCVQSAVKGLMQEKGGDATRLTRRRSLRSRAHSASLRHPRTAPQKRMKPYGICVAIPVYSFLLLLVSSVLSYCPEDWLQWWQGVRKTAALLLTFLSGPLIRWISHIPIVPVHRLEWLLGKFRPHAVQYISF
jgi:NmrA-like family